MDAAADILRAHGGTGPIRSIGSAQQVRPTRQRWMGVCNRVSDVHDSDPFQRKNRPNAQHCCANSRIAPVANAIVTIAVKSAPPALVPVVTPMGSDSGGPSTAEKCAAWPLVDASAIAWTIGLAPSTVQLTKIDASKPLASQLIGVQIAGVG